VRYPLKMKWMQIYKRSLYSGKLKLRYGWILAAMSAQNGIRIRNKQRQGIQLKIHTAIAL